MKNKIMISGFADEIDPDFRTQLETVTALGMRYICIRSANGKNIAKFTPEEAKRELKPLLSEFGVGVSSIGSPIGKVGLNDEKGYAGQLEQLRALCEVCALLDCRYIRIFSFYIPDGASPDACREQVLEKMAAFVEIAKAGGVTLLHENEKGIYGDIGRRNRDILETLNAPCLRAAFDFANYVQCQEDPESCWDDVQPYIEYIHIKDALFSNQMNVLFGTGDGKAAKLLDRAIRLEGYEGFLTLEPHLFDFSQYSALEKAGAKQYIGGTPVSSGGEAYAMQYRALLNILDGIDA